MNNLQSKIMFCSVIVLFFIILGLAMPSLSYASEYSQYENIVPNLKAEMVSGQFWCDKLDAPKSILMTSREIQKYNRLAISSCSKLFDLGTYRIAVSGASIKDAISKLSKKPKGDSYKDGEKLSNGYFENLKDNLNIEAIPEVIKVKFGITVKRTEMYSFPTSDKIFEEADDYEFGRLIETAVYPAEPLVILHESLDRKWYLAQSYNYLAWIPAASVAIAGRKEIFDVLDINEFLVITGKKIHTVFNPICREISELQLDMGVRIPLASKHEIPDVIDGQAPVGNYVVKLPVREYDGSLGWKLGLISWADDVSVGYLPFTRENIIKQSFKFLGQRYGWGGMFNARDCSSFILDNLRTMGLILPRNASEQGKLAFGFTYKLTKDDTLEQRKSIFDSIPPATPVYMNGHAMLYLGKSCGDYFIIHDFIRLRSKNSKGKMISYRTRSVFLTPLVSTFLSNGKTYMEGLYSAREFIIPSLKRR